MTSTAELARYWNERGDPLDWRRERPEADATAWRRAHEAFRGPDVEDALCGLGELSGRRVLELACGTGQGTLHLVRRGARVVGIDLAERRAARALEHLTREATGQSFGFGAARAERLPFPDAAFDHVFACDLLMYTSPAEVVRECCRVVTPGGRIAFVESLAGNPLASVWRRLTTAAGYRGFTRHLTLDELGALERGSGGRLRRLGLRAHYLTGAAAAVALFVLRSPGLHRLLISATASFDRRLLARWPGLGRVAWRGVAVYERVP